MIEHKKIPVAEFEAAVEAVKAAKYKAVTFLKTTDGLKQWAADPDFATVYLRAIARFKGIPKLNDMKERLKMHQKPDDKFTPYLKKAVGYIEATSPTKIEEFNKLFNDVLVKVTEWAKAGKVMDAGIMEVHEDLKIHVSAALPEST